MIHTYKSKRNPNTTLNLVIKSQERRGRWKMYKNKSKAIDKMTIEYTYLICFQWRRLKFDSWVGKIPWRQEWQPAPVFMPEEFHGQRNMESNSPWGCKESDNIELLSHIHTMIIILNGNGFNAPTKRQKTGWMDRK